MSSYYQQSAGGQYSLIPGAGTYMQDQNKAQNAYEKAVAQLKAQRARQQISSGLGSDWKVDPHAQFGTYQAMLQQQGSELNQAVSQAQDRGFFGRGFGNQGEGMLRYAHAVSNLGFQNQLSSWENDYQSGMADAARAKQDAMQAALQNSYDQGYDNQDYTPYVDDSQQGGPVIPMAHVGPGRVASNKVQATYNPFAPTRTRKQASKRVMATKRIPGGRI